MPSQALRTRLAIASYLWLHACNLAANDESVGRPSEPQSSDATGTQFADRAETRVLCAGAPCQESILVSGFPENESPTGIWFPGRAGRGEARTVPDGGFILMKAGPHVGGSRVVENQRVDLPSGDGRIVLGPVPFPLDPTTCNSIAYPAVLVSGRFYSVLAPPSCAQGFVTWSGLASGTWRLNARREFWWTMTTPFAITGGESAPLPWPKGESMFVDVPTSGLEVGDIVTVRQNDAVTQYAARGGVVPTVVRVPSGATGVAVLSSRNRCFWNAVPSVLTCPRSMGGDVPAEMMWGSDAIAFVE